MNASKYDVCLWMAGRWSRCFLNFNLREVAVCVQQDFEYGLGYQAIVVVV